MIKTLKVMLIPNNNQKSRLFQSAGTARFAYNWALARENQDRVFIWILIKFSLQIKLSNSKK